MLITRADAVATVLHRLKLVHTDLKPENILLVANESFVQGQRVSQDSFAGAARGLVQAPWRGATCPADAA
jgi:serine/threonine protein kinase